MYRLLAQVATQPFLCVPHVPHTSRLSVRDYLWHRPALCVGEETQPHRCFALPQYYELVAIPFRCPKTRRWRHGCRGDASVEVATQQLPDCSLVKEQHRQYAARAMAVGKRNRSITRPERPRSCSLPVPAPASIEYLTSAVHVLDGSEAPPSIPSTRGPVTARESSLLSERVKNNALEAVRAST